MLSKLLAAQEGGKGPEMGTEIQEGEGKRGEGSQ